MDIDLSRCRNMLIEHSHASEPQLWVWDFCLSISELSELRQALIVPVGVDSLKCRREVESESLSDDQKLRKSLVAAGMLICFKIFL